MYQDLQKASLWKRISAYIFDVILLVTVAVGVAFLLSTLFRYDSYAQKRAELRQAYEQEYGVTFDIAQEDYEKLSEDERQRIDDAYAKFAADPEVRGVDSLIINLSLLIVVFSLLIPFVGLEVLVPMAFGHGRTLGKKIFGVAIMRTDGVKISNFQLFARSILGKYTLETMLPVFLLLLLLLNILPVAALFGLAVLLFVQVAVLMFSRQHGPIHDAIAGTVAVDFASQMIFDTPEAALEYTKKLHAEKAERAGYN